MSLTHSPFKPPSPADWINVLRTLNDGSDGAYNPAVTANLVGGRLYKFTSLNIPAGVTITPSGGINGNLILLVQGVANIDGLLSASGKGGNGGAAVSQTAASGDKAGNVGANGAGPCGGAGGGASSNSVGGNGGSTQFAGGTPAVAGTSSFLTPNWGELDTILNYKGAGGGSGAVGTNSTGTVTGGAGGNGGGLIILLADSITGSGAIRADGVNGGNGIAGSPAYTAGGGGGGGGGLILLVSKIAATIATLSSAGGSAGSSLSNAYPLTAQASAGGSGLIFKVVS